MLFDDKKLSSDSVDDLLRCPVHSVEPYTLMLAPVYVFMKRNQKLVSVKAPLDFFLPDELEKLKQYENFYVPQFVEQAVAFQTAARVVKNILTKTQAELAPAPYEFSHEIFSLLMPLWGRDLRLEPFFMAVFAHELCDPFDHDLMIRAREETVVRHDFGLMLSGAFVFMAIQAGWHDHQMLTRFRNEIYERTVSGDEWAQPTNEAEYIVQTLNTLLSADTSISVTGLLQCNDEWARKVSSRIQNFLQKRGVPKTKTSSIYGEEGFAA